MKINTFCQVIASLFIPSALKKHSPLLILEKWKTKIQTIPKPGLSCVSYVPDETGRATLHEWALIFYGTSTLPDRTEYALYNPAASNLPRKSYGTARGTGGGGGGYNPRNGNVLTATSFKGKQKLEKTGHPSPPYVVNAGQQQTRKNKSRGQHKNGKSANRVTPRPTIQTLRGLTARGPNVGEPRLYTPRPRGRTTPGSGNPAAVSSTKTTTTTTQAAPITSTLQNFYPTISSQQRGLILMEPLAKTAGNKVPEIFQQYPKIQQLYPLYPVYAGARGAGQHSPRAKGLDLLQDEQFDSRNLHLDKGTENIEQMHETWSAD